MQVVAVYIPLDELVTLMNNNSFVAHLLKSNVMERVLIFRNIFKDKLNTLFSKNTYLLSELNNDIFYNKIL